MTDLGQGQRPAARPAKRDRWLGAAVSLLAHLSIVVGLFFWVRPDAQKLFEPAAVTVALVAEPVVAPAPTPAKPAAPAKRPVVARRSPAKPLPPRKIAKPAPAHRHVVSRPAEEAAPATGESSELSEAQLAGAASADSGPPGGGACDMARRLQSALRRDQLVQAAVAQTHHGAGSAGRAIMVWNGDWVQSNGEDGKGLAAVREAIMWEVAFAPKACRSEPVRGLILLSLNSAPGSARLAVGSGEWRWSDLLR